MNATSTNTPPQEKHDETVEEYLARGGKITKLPPAVANGIYSPFDRTFKIKHIAYKGGPHE